MKKNDPERVNNCIALISLLLFVLGAALYFMPVNNVFASLFLLCSLILFAIALCKEPSWPKDIKHHRFISKSTRSYLDYYLYSEDSSKALLKEYIGEKKNDVDDLEPNEKIFTGIEYFEPQKVGPYKDGENVKPDVTSQLNWEHRIVPMRTVGVVAFGSLTISVLIPIIAAVIVFALSNQAEQAAVAVVAAFVQIITSVLWSIAYVKKRDDIYPKQALAAICIWLFAIIVSLFITPDEGTSIVFDVLVVERFCSSIKNLIDLAYQKDQIFHGKHSK